jgi:hypothetical protein
MKIKKILFGEKTPDENDPKFQKLREESEAAGRKVTQMTGMGKFVAKVQRFAENHQKVFFGIILAYVFFASIIAIQRVNYLWYNRPQQSSAVERQERELGFKHLAVPEEPEGEGSDNVNLNQ